MGCEFITPIFLSNNLLLFVVVVVVVLFRKKQLAYDLLITNCNNSQTKNMCFLKKKNVLYLYCRIHYHYIDLYFHYLHCCSK